MSKSRRFEAQERVNRARSSLMADQCYAFVKPLLGELNRRMDRRLVRTFLGTVMAIVMHRHRANGLLLSELGGYLLSDRQAPAGTKRLSRLLHSERWASKMIDMFLWGQADERVDELAAQGEAALVVWDESVIEKPESIALEGLCPVRSTKAARLKRIKPGYFNPPGGRPVFVPGMNWLQVLVLGRRGPPTLAHMRWWTTRGELTRDKRTVEGEVLAETVDHWGFEVIHVWDRGFAGAPWLTLAYVHAVRFIMRWPKRYHLLDEEGHERPAWQLTRGKRSWEHRMLWDARRRCECKTGVVAVPVQDRDHQQPLWLVVARRGQGREPWYLLTNEPIRSPEDAWRIVLAYARRWQIEMALRFAKSELAFQSPRLRDWEPRCKLLLLATLAHAFLLSLLAPLLIDLRDWLLSTWCRRTGERSRSASAPLYRLRFALCRLWLTHPPPFLSK